MKEGISRPFYCNIGLFRKISKVSHYEEKTRPFAKPEYTTRVTVGRTYSTVLGLIYH